jgi:hypothetical protein
MRAHPSIIVPSSAAVRRWMKSIQCTMLMKDRA